MASRKPFTYEKFRKIYSEVTRSTVDVIVKNKQGVALTLRSIEPHRGEWHVPGSTILYGEKALQTARRVARDELSVGIRNLKFLGYLEYNEEPHRGFGRSVSLVFLANFASGKLAPDGDASAAAYFSRLPKDLIPAQRKFLTAHRHEIGLR